MIPRYATPTKSSRLYAYTNKDQDLVKLGFRAGNFTFLKKFPPRIKPFSVSVSLKEHSRKNLLKTPRSVSVRRSEGYAWMPDNFNRKEEVQRKSRAESVNRRKSISNKDFVPSGSPTKTRNLYDSFISVNSSYSSASDQITRLKWIKDSRIHQASFKSGRPLPATKSVYLSEEIIKALKIKISQDWKLANFSVVLDANKCIELKVVLGSIETAESMGYYLNTLINKNPEFLKFCLRKMPGKWGLKAQKHLVFTMAPQWVHLPTIPRQKVPNEKVVYKSFNVHRLGLISTRNSSLSIR